MSKPVEPGTIDSSRREESRSVSTKHRELVTAIVAWKRQLRRLENCVEENKYWYKYFNARVKKYSRQPPKVRLFYRDLEVKAEALGKKTAETLAEDEGLLKRAYLEFGQFLLAYEGSPYKTWHKIAQLLGVSHVLLGNFLKTHADIKEVSLINCVLRHAEVWGEKEYERQETATATRSRSLSLLRTIGAYSSFLIETDCAFRYRAWKWLDSRHPGTIPPEWIQPERNFTVIPGSHERTDQE